MRNKEKMSTGGILLGRHSGTHCRLTQCIQLHDTPASCTALRWNSLANSMCCCRTSLSDIGLYKLLKQAMVVFVTSLLLIICLFILLCPRFWQDLHSVQRHLLLGVQRPSPIQRHSGRWSTLTVYVEYTGDLCGVDW